MNPKSGQSNSFLRDNVRLYVDFRAADFSQIRDFIRLPKGLVRNVAVFSYLMIDVRERGKVLEIISDLRLDDYIYLDLELGQAFDDLGIDMILTTSPRLNLYSDTRALVSGGVGKAAQLINVDHTPIKDVFETVSNVYFQPTVLQ